MGRTCVVGNCDMQKIIGISFHRIPATMLGDTRRKWIELIKHSRNDANWEPNGNERICGHHFNRWMELAKPSDSDEPQSQTEQELTPVAVPQAQTVRRSVPENKPKEAVAVAPVSIVKPNLVQVKQERNGGHSSNSVYGAPLPPPPALKKIKLSPSPPYLRPINVEPRINPNAKIPAMPRLQPKTIRPAPAIQPMNIRPAPAIQQIQPQPLRSNPIINRISNQITVTYVGDSGEDMEDDPYDQEPYEESNSEGLPIPSCLVEAVFTEGSEPELENEYDNDNMIYGSYSDDQNQVQINNETEFHFNSNSEVSIRKSTPPPPVFTTFKYPRMGDPNKSRFISKFGSGKGAITNGFTSKSITNGNDSREFDDDECTEENSPNKLELFNKILRIMNIGPLKPEEGLSRPEIGNIAREKVNTLKSKMLEMIDVEDFEADIAEEYLELRQKYNDLLSNTRTNYEDLSEDHSQTTVKQEVDLISESH